MNSTDREMTRLAKEALDRMPVERICQRGLQAGQKAVTIVAFADGSEARLWNYANGRQVSSVSRKQRKDVAAVTYAVVERGGWGDLVRVEGRFTLDRFALIPA